MIKIHKTEPPPEIASLLERYAQETLTKNDAYSRQAPRNYRQKLTKVRPLLAGFYHGKCGFCESRIEPSISHYRPKRSYPWLWCEWTNLVPICSACGSRKRDLFPVSERKPFTSDDSDARALQAEEPLLLHPEYDDPEQHLRFNLDGTIHPITERGKATIDLCGLDRKTLNENRDRKIKLLKASFQALVQTLQGKETRERAETVLNSFLPVLEQEATPDAEYALLGRCMLRDFTEFFLDDSLESSVRAILEIAYNRFSYRFRPLIDVPSETHYLLSQKQALPLALKQLFIANYQGIKQVKISDLPVDAQWIFITGENGYGKTSILQALAIGLCGKQDADRVLADDDCRVSIELQDHDRCRLNSPDDPHFEPVIAFAGYGSSRLNIQSRDSKNKIREKNTPTYSLFNTDGVLLSIETLLHDWSFKEPSKFETLRDALLVALTYLGDIRVEHDKSQDRDEVHYLEKSNKGTYDPLPFEYLASGHKNIIGMVGDLYLRLREQSSPVQPSELHGIVLIDELDLHLHPKWLRELPSLLSRIFPKVQFIASTHSALPVLGAPEASIFLKVERSHEQGTTLQRQELDVRNLLPNALLTSPLFDLERILPEANQDLSSLRSEDDYQLIERRRKRDQRLAEADQDPLFPDSFFEDD